MGKSFQPGQSLYAFLFGLGSGSSSDLAEPPPPDLTLLANFRRLVGVEARRGKYMEETVDLVRESILTNEEVLAQTQPDQYFRERIKLYRHTTIQHLKMVNLVFRPQIQGINDHTSLTRHISNEGVPLDTVVDISEQLSDISLRPMSIVHFLCLVGDVDTLRRVLLEAKADKTQLQELRDPAGNTPLHYACMGGSVNMVCYLMDEIGMLTDVPNQEGTVPLHWLPMFDQERMSEITDRLLNEPSALNAVSSGLCIPIHSLWLRGPPLHWAVSCRNQEAVKNLLRAGCDVNAEFGGYSALAKAVEMHAHEIVETLLDHGAEMNCIGEFERCAMHFLAGNAPLMKRQIIHWAPLAGSTQPSTEKSLRRTVEKLLSYGCDINTRDNHGNTALHKAVASPFERGDEKCLYVVRELIRNGADRNAQNDDGDSALHLAMLFSLTDKPNNLVLAQMLLDESIALMDVNPVQTTLQDRNGRIPWMVSGLVSCSADYSSMLTQLERDETVKVVTSKDNDGKTVMDFLNTPPDESLRYFWGEKKRMHKIGLGVTLFNNCS
jgi:ankyrin repeat protein